MQVDSTGYKSGNGRCGLIIVFDRKVNSTGYKRNMTINVLKD